MSDTTSPQRGPVFQLPNSGDLWSPPIRDEHGNHIPRPNTVDLSNLKRPIGTSSPDVTAGLMAANAENAAILMAENMELKAALLDAQRQSR